MAILNLGRVVPGADGRCSSKFRDGSGSSNAPSIPVLGQPVATAPTSVTVPLQTPSTGPSTPISYSLERSLSEISGYSVIAASATIFDPDGEYVDGTVVANTQYFYRVKAIGADLLESAYSLVVNVTTPAVTGDTTAPSVPTNVTLVDIGTQSDRLRTNWTLSTDNVAVQDYDVTLGIGDGAGNPVGTGSVIATVTAPPFDILGLQANQEYYVRIKARDTSGNTSAATARVFQTTPAGPPVGQDADIFENDFSTGTILPQTTPFPGGWYENFSEPGGPADSTPGAWAIVTTTGGGYNGRSFYLRTKLKADPPLGGDFRGEHHARVANKAIGLLLEQGGYINTGVPVYFSMAVRLPTGYIIDPLTGETLCQWHHGTVGPAVDSIHAGHYGIAVRENRWELARHGGEGGSPLQGGPAFMGDITPDIGQWVFWVSRWVFSGTASGTQTGSIKIWRNPTAESDTPAFQVSNVRTFNPEGSAPKHTIGIYKPQWRKNNFTNNYYAPGDPRIIHHGLCRVGSTYAKVTGP